MPWCPEGHGEYREGFTRCAECGAELVAAPPESSREVATPSSDAGVWRRSTAWLATEPDWEPQVAVRPRAVRAETGEAYDVQLSRVQRWATLVGLHFLAGLRLFPHALRRLLGMRKVWVVLWAAACAYTALTVAAPPSALGGPSSDPLLGGLFSSGPLVELERRWATPAAVSESLTRGVLTPTGFATGWTGTVGLRFSPDAWMRLVTDQWSLVSLGLLWLLPAVLLAFATAGIMGLILAGLRGAPRQWGGMRAVWRLFWWTLLISGAAKILLAFVIGHRGWEPQFPDMALRLLLVLTVFTDYLIVARRSSVWSAVVDSPRALWRRLALIAGFLVPFRVVYEGISLLTAEAAWQFNWASPPVPHQAVALQAVGVLLATAKVVLELGLVTAFLLIVERTALRSAPVEPASVGA